MQGNEDQMVSVRAQDGFNRLGLKIRLTTYLYCGLGISYYG